MKGAVVSASDARVLAVTREIASDMRAVDAVVTGVLVACVLRPSVWLGPLEVLVAGPGTGQVGIDGRSTQPGKGAKRPRGTVSGSEPEPAAFVAVPTLPAAVATLVSGKGEWSISNLVDRVLAATPSESSPRRQWVADFGRVGPLGVYSGRFAEALVAQFGPVQGGLLTRQDLESVRPEWVVARPIGEDDRYLGLQSDTQGAPVDPAPPLRFIAAGDSTGHVAVAAYCDAEDGVEWTEFGLSAPKMAVPVARGVTRVTPGAKVRAPAGLVLRVAATGLVDAAFGYPGEWAATLAEGLQVTTPWEAEMSSSADICGVEVTGGGARAALFHVRG